VISGENFSYHVHFRWSFVSQYQNIYKHWREIYWLFPYNHV
jgi:hypothetical protein